MVKETKKEVNHKGNTFYQDMESFQFIKDYRTWKENCLSISGEDLHVEHIDSLYDFLFVHVFGNIRDGSVNQGRDGEGAREALEVIEGIIDGSVFTIGEAGVISAMAEVLAELENSSLDPKDILFTEWALTRGRKKKRKIKLYGHYRTKAYEEKTGKKAAPDEWFAGQNPPHEALFSESSNRWAKPKGLLHIMKEAKGMVKEMEIRDLEISNLGTTSPKELEEISAIANYFDDVIKNTAFWNEGGRLLVNKIRKDLQARSFKLMNKDQELVANLANFHADGKNKTPAGKIVDFTITSTALPIITLVDAALKRAGKNTAPNGFRAWQNQRKTGFDYRKTAREKWGEDTGKYKPDAKVISKMWQAILWRR